MKIITPGHVEASKCPKAIIRIVNKMLLDGCTFITVSSITDKAWPNEYNVIMDYFNNGGNLSFYQHFGWVVTYHDDSMGSDFQPMKIHWPILRSE